MHLLAIIYIRPHICSPNWRGSSPDSYLEVRAQDSYPPRRFRQLSESALESHFDIKDVKIIGISSTRLIPGEVAQMVRAQDS